jgi:hypothetical protein
MLPGHNREREINMNEKQEMFHTMNLMVATVLLSCGFRLITYTHIVRQDGKQSKDFWFEANSPDCKVPTTPHERERKHWSKADYVSYYLTKGSGELAATDPEHPLLWMRAALMNRNQLVDIVKNAPTMIEISNGTRRALIAANASDEAKRKIAAML